MAESTVEGPGHITISPGVTTGSAREERTDLLRRLDKVLYRAKQPGRDRVCVEPEPADHADADRDTGGH